MNRNLFLDTIMGRVVRELNDAGMGVTIFPQENEYVFLQVFEEAGESQRRMQRGYVRLTPGNEPEAIISDYTMNLEAVLKPAIDYAEHLQKTFA